VRLREAELISFTAKRTSCSTLNDSISSADTKYGMCVSLLYFPFSALILNIYIRGIRNVIFYGLPQYPHFYSEILNLLQESELDVSTVTALYSKFDIYQLQGIVGDDRARIMLGSDKDTHMFC